MTKRNTLIGKMGVVQKLNVGRDGRCRAAVVQVKSGLLMDREKEAAEGEVPPPRRTRSGREIVRPHRLRLKCSCNMLMQVTRWRKSKAKKILDLRTFRRFAYYLSLGKHAETSVTVALE